MNIQDQKFKLSWEKTKSKGRLVYGLTHGSIFGFVVFIVINLFKLKDSSISQVYFNQVSLEQMLTMVFAGIIGYSTLKWWMNQNIYKKIIDKETNLMDKL